MNPLSMHRVPGSYYGKSSFFDLLTKVSSQSALWSMTSFLWQHQRHHKTLVYTSPECSIPRQFAHVLFTMLWPVLVLAHPRDDALHDQYRLDWRDDAIPALWVQLFIGSFKQVVRRCHFDVLWSKNVYFSLALLPWTKKSTDHSLSTSCSSTVLLASCYPAAAWFVSIRE